MKKTLPYLLLTVILLVACGTPPSGVEKRLFRTQTIHAPDVRTEEIVKNLSIDPVTGLPATTFVTNVVYRPGPVREILAPNENVATGFEWLGKLPVPYAGPIGAALAFAYGAYMQVRNKKIQGTLVDNVEQFGSKLFETNPTAYDATLKEVVSHQAISGVREAIIPLVQART